MAFAKTKTNEIIMKENAREVENLINQIKQSFIRLNDINKELDLYWQGGDRDLFSSLFAGNMDLYSRHLNMLQEYNNKFKESINIYEKADNEARNIANAIKVS